MNSNPWSLPYKIITSRKRNKQRMTSLLKEDATWTINEDIHRTLIKKYFPIDVGEDTEDQKEIREARLEWTDREEEKVT